MFLGMGPMELIIILAIALIIFGPKNLPKLGKSLGETVKNVREGMDGDDEKPAKAVEETTTATEPAPVPQPVAEPAQDVEVEEEEDVIFCSKCGAQNKAGDAFCSKCGNKLSA